MRNRYLASIPLVALALVVALLIMFRPVEAVGEPSMAHTESVRIVTLLDRTVTASGVSSVTAANRVDLATAADVFVTVSFSGTGDIEVTPQFSADGVNWVNAYHRYLETTGEYTGTYTTDLVTANYAMFFDGDGTAYERVPLAGVWMRFDYVVSDISGSEEIDVLVRAVIKN